jgi:basic membrane protein A
LRSNTRRGFLQFALVTAITSSAALVLAGCPSGADKTASSGDASQAPAVSSAVPTTARKIKAGLVTDVGGVNDRSFNALAWDGLQRVQKEFGADVKYTESHQNADYVANLSRYAQNDYDVVFAVGFLMQDALKEVAPLYPKVKFAIIDGDAPNLPNCVSYKFREEEGSYLVGALAGAMTKTNAVGFVGGMEMPLIKKFEAGYTAGVKTTNPKASVIVGYAGKFDDPEKGQEIALSQMSARADVIFHAAGKTGIGVIKAVENKGPGYYAIGVDKDQDGDAPGRVLTSMVKHVDVAVFNVCKSVVDGDFKPGTVVLGLKEDGVGISAMKYTKQDVPPAVLQKIETLKQEIIDGKLKPPTRIDAVASFQPPKEFGGSLNP